MSIDSEPPGGAVKVTIKYGKGYEETWANFFGSVPQVRENLIDFFGLTDTDGLTLDDLVVNATAVAHAKGNLGKAFGGQVVSGTSARETAPSAAPAAPEGPSEKELLLKAVDEQPDVAALKRLWAENQAAFADPDLMAAYKAKGKKLSGK